MADFESLTLDVTEESPCGDSLEYDPAFAELEIAARGKPEQHFGATLVPAQEPEWRQVRSKALALLQRTRDLRIAVLLARAETALEGLPGLAGALELIRQLLLKHWDHVHPQLDPEDDRDPMLRMNALAALVDPAGLLRDLGGAAFVQSPGAGSCTLRDAERALGLLRPAEDQEPPMTRAQLASMVRAHAAAGGHNESQRVFETARALHSVLIDRAGPHQALDLGPLLQKLKPLAAFHAEALGQSWPLLQQAGEAAGSGGAGVAAADTGPASGAGAAAAGSAADARPTTEIQSREEALQALERVCLYVERHEPANPAPLLIRRAQRLLKMNFLDILRDVAPEGMSSIEKIAGIPPAE